MLLWIMIQVIVVATKMNTQEGLSVQSLTVFTRSLETRGQSTPKATCSFCKLACPILCLDVLGVYRQGYPQNRHIQQKKYLSQVGSIWHADYMSYFGLIENYRIALVISQGKLILLFVSLLFAGEMGRQVQEYKFKLTRAEQEVTTLEGSVSLNPLTCWLLKFEIRYHGCFILARCK